MLSDQQVRKAQARDKSYKLFDYAGLYLEVAPNGSKYWRLKYRLYGKERRFAIGLYPQTGLKEARKERDRARELIEAGTDPCEHRRAAEREATMRAVNTFEGVAREWYAKHSPSWAATYRDKVISRLERDLFPWLGNRPIAVIEAPEILVSLRRVEARDCNETAHRELQYCSRVFRYAIATGRARRDPAADLRGEALAPVDRTRHYGTLTEPKAVGALLRAIDAYSGGMVTKSALRLLPLVFVRPSELRKAVWSEIDFDAAEWRIPAERMKARQVHIVPLSLQAKAVLQELQPLTGHHPLVFPNPRSPLRAMSENAITAALRAMGYEAGQMTGHGFRAMASTLLNEQQWNSDVIERQLAHCERNRVRAAYNYAEHLPERRRMMQAWADYLDGLRRGAEIRRLHAA